MTPKEKTLKLFKEALLFIVVFLCILSVFALIILKMLNDTSSSLKRLDKEVEILQQLHNKQREDVSQ